MKLYTHRLAPSPRRVAIYIAERGLAIESAEMEIMRNDNLSADFLRLSPLGEVPTLVLDDGESLTESAAICRFLDEQFPPSASGIKLFGGNLRERARIEMWTRRLEWNLLRHIFDAFRHSHRASKNATPIKECGEFAAANARKFCRFLDDELKKRTHIAGEDFSFADITAISGLDFGRSVGIRADDSATPNLAEWNRRVKSRPSIGEVRR